MNKLKELYHLPAFVILLMPFIVYLVYKVIKYNSISDIYLMQEDSLDPIIDDFYERYEERINFTTNLINLVFWCVVIFNIVTLLIK